MLFGTDHEMVIWLERSNTYMPQTIHICAENTGRLLETGATVVWSREVTNNSATHPTCSLYNTRHTIEAVVASYQEHCGMASNTC